MGEQCYPQFFNKKRNSLIHIYLWLLFQYSQVNIMDIRITVGKKVK